MKFIYMTCNISMVEIIWDLLDEMEISNYQTIEPVTAKSNYAEPRLNTAVWPGYNASVLVQESDSEKAASLIKEINAINDKAFNTGELIAAHLWNVDKSTEIKKTV